MTKGNFDDILNPYVVVFLSLTNKGDKLLLFLDAFGETIDTPEEPLNELYEQAFFTTFQLKKKTVPLWNFHWSRLVRSAQHYSVKFKDSLEVSLLEHLKKIDENSRVRITFSFLEKNSLTVIIEAREHNFEMKENLKLKTQSRKSCSRPSFVKFGNYVKAFEKRAELQKQGFDDFLFWEESDGRILESTVSNLVYCQNGKWYTPKLGHGILEGSTRSAMLELSLVEEKDLFIKDLAKCTSLFLINAITGIVSVEYIDDRKLFIDQEMRLLCSNRLHDKMWNNTAIDV